MLRFIYVFPQCLFCQSDDFSTLELRVLTAASVPHACGPYFRAPSCKCLLTDKYAPSQPKAAAAPSTEAISFGLGKLR